jgi:mono/diheme cytochrome c family protein
MIQDEREEMSMKFAISFFLLVFVLPSAHAQVPRSNSPLSETEKAGRTLFMQRCELCHLAVPPRTATLGPLLDRELVVKRGDAEIRKSIMNGSARMPGFQYGLEPGDIDEIIAFLKTVTFKRQ